MLCEEIENRILDFQENQLSAAQRAEVESHLAGCANCRLLAQRLHRLDATLRANVKVPALSADFEQRLWERVEAAPSALSEAQRAERKRQLEAEFEAGVARLHHGAFASGGLWQYLASPAVAALAGGIAWACARQWTIHFNPASVAGIPANLIPWLAASGIILVAGLVEILPRRWKIIWV
jgi:anti-sigma factor RsiW